MQFFIFLVKEMCPYPNVWITLSLSKRRNEVLLLGYQWPYLEIKALQMQLSKNEVIRVGPPLWPVSLRREETQRHASRQGLYWYTEKPRNTQGCLQHQKLGERHETDAPVETSERGRPCQHLDSRLQASGTVTEHISVIQHHSFVVLSHRALGL